MIRLGVAPIRHPQTADARLVCAACWHVLLYFCSSPAGTSRASDANSAGRLHACAAVPVVCRILAAAAATLNVLRRHLHPALVLKRRRYFLRQADRAARARIESSPVLQVPTSETARPRASAVSLHTALSTLTHCVHERGRRHIDRAHALSRGIEKRPPQRRRCAGCKLGQLRECCHAVVASARTAPDAPVGRKRTDCVPQPSRQRRCVGVLIHPSNACPPRTILRCQASCTCSWDRAFPMASRGALPVREPLFRGFAVGYVACAAVGLKKCGQERR